MISAAEYLADPCGTLSVPYWKARGISVPPGVKIVHDSEFSEGLLDRYTDTPYFRLIHRLRDIPGFCVPDVVCRTIGPDYTGELADMINICYAHSGIRVFDGDVKGWMDSAAYCPGLWIGAFGSGGLSGSVICAFDRETGEASIEWLQVLPAYRRRGIAAALVCQALERIRGFAGFATVAGECGNVTAPERVYRRCGFTGGDVWHILREISDSGRGN